MDMDNVYKKIKIKLLFKKPNIYFCITLLLPRGKNCMKNLIDDTWFEESFIVFLTLLS